MKVLGEHTFDSPRERVWQALLDPAVLARVLPGTERLERTGENEYRGVMNVQVGPVKGQFQGALRLSDLVAPESYRLKLDGSGPAGFLNGQGELRLEEAATGGTLLRYDLDTQVGGRLAGVGQRLLESSARSIARQGLEGLGRELRALQEQEAARAAAPAGAVAGPDSVTERLAAAAAAPPPIPTQAEIATRVAADVARDLLPPPRRSLALGAALVALGLLVLFALRSCGA